MSRPLQPKLPPNIKIVGNASGITITGSGDLCAETYSNGIMLNNTFYENALFPGMNLQVVRVAGSSWNSIRQQAHGIAYDPNNSVDPSLMALLGVLRRTIPNPTPTPTPTPIVQHWAPKNNHDVSHVEAPPTPTPNPIVQHWVPKNNPNVLRVEDGDELSIPNTRVGDVVVGQNGSLNVHVVGSAGVERDIVVGPGGFVNVSASYF